MMYELVNLAENIERKTVDLFNTYKSLTLANSGIDIEQEVLQESKMGNEILLDLRHLYTFIDLNDIYLFGNEGEYPNFVTNYYQYSREVEQKINNADSEFFPKQEPTIELVEGVKKLRRNI